MEFGGDFFETFLEGSVDLIIYRNYIANQRFFIYYSLATHTADHETLPRGGFAPFSSSVYGDLINIHARVINSL